MNLEARTAIEALRAGVPNRAAVRLMGSAESRHRARLRRPACRGLGGGRRAARPWHRRRLRRRQVAYARPTSAEVARTPELRRQPRGRQQGNAARRSRPPVRGRDALAPRLPGRNDDALAGALAALRAHAGAVRRAGSGGARPGQPSGPRLRRDAVPAAPPNRLRRTARRCERFLAGGRMAATVFRQALAQGRRAAHVRREAAGRPPSWRCSASASPALLFHARRLRRLVPAAGRGRADRPLYPAAARRRLCLAGDLAGLEGAVPFPGVATVYAITDDFVAAVIETRQDTERLSERLLLKGREQEATTAVAAIRHIEDTVGATACLCRARRNWHATATGCARSTRRLMTGPRQCWNRGSGRRPAPCGSTSRRGLPNGTCCASAIRAARSSRRRSGAIMRRMRVWPRRSPGRRTNSG